MARVYDNWERLVRATLQREELRLIALRTPSNLSLASLSPSPSSSSSSALGMGNSFTYDQILQATNNFSSSNLIMCGRTGDLFMGILEGGIRVVVKKIHLSIVDKELYLIQELEFYSKISHSRFVPLLGHCLVNEISKFLVYKHMHHKDLYSFWFNKIVQDYGGNGLEWLNWNTRLKIAKGAAEGLFYLHHKCDPPLVHRNIEASSILLDHNFEVRLGRLSEVCPERKETNQNRTARFLHFIRGSERDIPGIFDATPAFDVYCFGKVLLELVTGKLEFRVPNDSTLKDSMAITLANITAFDKKLVLNIVDRSLIIDEDLLMEVWAVAFVAKKCLDPKPSKRLEMSYVLEALRNPSTVVTSFRGLSFGRTKLPKESK